MNATQTTATTRELLALDHGGREISRVVIKAKARAITVGDTAILITGSLGGAIVIDRTGAMLARLLGHRETWVRDAARWDLCRQRG